MMTLAQAGPQTSWIVHQIRSLDSEVLLFILTLGCFEGQRISVISVMGKHLVININDTRFTIDRELAKSIYVFPA
jgi:Fe2+ transport system protein FeoA